MAHRVCISHSESFLEISARDLGANNTLSCRYYLPKLSVEKALSDFWAQSQIESLESIVLALKSSRTILRRRLGNSPALIVTEGFENWLDMNLPIKTKAFTLAPARVKSLLDSDWVFGVKERTDANGSVLTEVNVEELEFLASKLEMSKIRNISVGLLHSNKNPKNELFIRDFFAAKGFQVFTSHQMKTSHNERQRWLTPVMDAYLEPLVRDQMEGYLNTPQLEGAIDHLQLATGQGLTSASTPTILSTLMGDLYLLQKCPPTMSATFFFGVEDFFRIYPDEIQHEIETEVGVATLTCPKHNSLGLSPTHFLRPDFWGVGGWSDFALGYEPGPICIGRGLQPTFLDLLFLYTPLESIQPFEQMLIPQNKGRILEALNSYTKELKQEWSHSEMIESLLRLALTPIVNELAQNRTNLFLGPLAPVMKLVIERLFRGLQMDVHPEYAFSGTRFALSPQGGIS
jgi:hypothetical protein